MSKKEKLSKDEKKAAKQEKKALKKEKNSTPEAMDFKQNLVKSVTAIICVAIFSFSVSGAVEAYCEAVKAEAEAASKVTASAGVSGGNQAGTSNNGSSSDSNSGTSYEVPGDAATPDDATTPADSATPGDSTAPADSTPASDSSAPAADADPLSTTAGIIDYYNKAVKATNPAPKGQQTMTLRKGSLTGDGAIGTIVKVLEPAAVKALAKNSKETDWIPGHKNDLLVSDVVSAKATRNNGIVTINIKLKDQVDGSDGDASNGGPVARGIGTLGSIDSALSELGAEFSSGRETVKLTYNNASISVQINEKTGKIEHGTWKHTVNIFIGEAKAKLGISVTLKNFKGIVDYQVVI